MLSHSKSEAALLAQLCAVDCKEVRRDPSLRLVVPQLFGKPAAEPKLIDFAASVAMRSFGTYMCHRGRLGWSGTSPDDRYDTDKKQ
jgi:hypothetical protein